MATTAKISSAEISAQIQQRFVNKYVETLLVNANGVSYQPGITVDATFLSFECAQGVGGYERQVFVYQPQDQTAFTDSGVGLQTKGAIFAHDGSGDDITFTHAVLVWGQGNVISLDAATLDPAQGVDGVYTDIPTSTDGNGTGLTVDIVVSNDVFVFTPSNYGRNYEIGDQISITEAAMVAVGAIAEGAGGAIMDVTNVSTNSEAGSIIAVAGTTGAVVLDAGNEAAFYWDLKLYGIN